MRLPLSARGPVHDRLCRCRGCKPPLAGLAHLEATRRLELVLAALLVVGLLLWVL